MLRIADPCIDDTVFDAYLSSVPKGVRVRLLAGKASANLKQAVEKFTIQHGLAVEAKVSNACHD
jgi:hypothetical protein